MSVTLYLKSLETLKVNVGPAVNPAPLLLLVPQLLKKCPQCSTFQRYDSVSPSASVELSADRLILQQGCKLAPPEITATGALLAALELDDELTLELDGGHEGGGAIGLPFGAVAQVLCDIQLLLFSQPQPLCVVWQMGYNVPYQLHCAAVLVQVPRDELVILETELRTDELDDELALEAESTTVKNVTDFVAELPASSVTVSETVLLPLDVVIENPDSDPVARVTGSLP